MHVIGFKARAGECRSHFGLGVDTLFAQHGKLRTHTCGNVGSGNALFVVKGGLYEQSLDVLVTHPVGFAVGAHRVIAVAGDGVGNFAPGAREVRAGFAQDFLAVFKNDERVLVVELAHSLKHCFQPFGLDFGHHFVETICRYLDERTEFFGKEPFKNISAQHFGIESHTAVRGKHHFRGRCGKAAVTAVVIGKDATGKRELTNKTHEFGERFGAVHIGSRVAEALHALRENRGAHAVLSETEVGGKEHTLYILTEFRCERQAHVANRRCCRNDERYRTRHTLGFFAVLPGSAH